MDISRGLDPRVLLIASCGFARSETRGARVRRGADSRPETLLRLLITSAGLPEPELGVNISDERGSWIGRFDMVYSDRRVIVEYDGDQHRRSTAQYDKDMTRIDRAIAAEWTVVRVRARGLFRDQGETLTRVRTALKLH